MADIPVAIAIAVPPLTAAPLPPQAQVRLAPPPVPVPSTMKEALNRLKFHQLYLDQKSAGDLLELFAYAIERTPIHFDQTSREPLPKNIELANALRAFLASAGVQTHKATIGINYVPNPPIPASHGQIQRFDGQIMFISDSLVKPYQRVRSDEIASPPDLVSAGGDGLATSEVAVSVEE